jgi:hypothetical protein
MVVHETTKHLSSVIEDMTNISFLDTKPSKQELCYTILFHETKFIDAIINESM